MHFILIVQAEEIEVFRDLGHLTSTISIRRTGARCLHRKNGTFEFNDQPLPKFSQQLRENGHCILRGVFPSDEIRHFEDDISRVFHQDPPDGRPNSYIEEGGDMFRYQMFNRSALCQQAIAHPSILSTVEPLLGNDCHVISNTAWRNPPDQKSKDFYWHIDGAACAAAQGCALARQPAFSGLRH